MTGGGPDSSGSRAYHPDFWARMRHRMFRVLRHLPGVPGLEIHLRYRLLTRDLQRMNDVLAETPFAGRYRVFGGMLLGWAREGRLLPHDLDDVDFAYDEDDHEHFLAAVPALERAGFRRLFRYRSNDGVATEHCFVRHGAKFEFFRLERVEGRHRYHLYVKDPDDPGRHIEMLGAIDVQPLAPFEFLGRSWLKPADHERELEARYGRWRIPDPAWTWYEECSIVERREWVVTSYEWT